MTNPTITIFDAITGEVIEREMTTEEAALHETIIANACVLQSHD